MNYDLSSHNLSVEDAVELALDKPLWRVLAASGVTHWNDARRTMMPYSPRMQRHHITKLQCSVKHTTYHFKLGLIGQLCLAMLRLALMSFHYLLQIPINTLSTISFCTMSPKFCICHLLSNILQNCAVRDNIDSENDIQNYKYPLKSFL